MKPIGSSASSEVWFQPKRRKRLPQTRKTSAKTSTKTFETMRRSAPARGPRSGQTSTSKWVRSRMPIIAPIITIQMNRKRDSSSVQI